MNIDEAELQAHKLNLGECRRILMKARRALDNEGHELADDILEAENILDYELDDVIDNWLSDEMIEKAIDYAKLEKWKQWAKA